MPIYINGNLQIDPALESLSMGQDPDDGIKIGLDDPTYAWQDLIGSVRPDPERQNAPDLEIYNGSIRAYAFSGGTISTGDKADIEYHVPHDYAVGTDLYIHVHWSHTCATISDDIEFRLEYTYAKRTYEPMTAFSTPQNQSISVTGLDITNYPKFCHAVNEIQMSKSGGGIGYLNTDDIEIDGIILANLTQIVTPTLGSPEGSSVAEPYILTVDIHYQSTGVGTKSSGPDYYT